LQLRTLLLQLKTPGRNLEHPDLGSEHHYCS
jgi:hypothetical protein